MEPPLKKVKHESETKIGICDGTAYTKIDNYIDKIKNTDKPLEMVLADEIFKPVPMTKMHIGIVRNPKDISRIIALLNEKVPLKEFQHLKRVRFKQVIICPCNLNKTSSIQEFIEKEVTELKDLIESYSIIELPIYVPKLKSQVQELSKLWSFNFHPDKYLELIVSGNRFSATEIKRHRTLMSLVFYVVKFYLKDTNKIDLEDTNVVVVADPKTQSIVAIAFDHRKDHPIQHAAMLAIDNVAKTQEGGAWNIDNIKNKSGIDSVLLEHLKSNFSDIRFEAIKFSKDDQNGPYLCTGYDIYMIREPCLMCAMALIHARAKRIFYCFDNAFGVLKTKIKLHTVPSLNHHYEVFTQFL